MHGVVFQMIAEEMGEYDVEHVKDLMKEKFLRYPVLVKTKTKKFQEYKIKHTSELDTKEMKEFIDKCKHWAATYLGINIPDPQVIMKQKLRRKSSRTFGAMRSKQKQQWKRSENKADIQKVRGHMVQCKYEGSEDKADIQKVRGHMVQC